MALKGLAPIARVSCVSWLFFGLSGEAHVLSSLLMMQPCGRAFRFCTTLVHYVHVLSPLPLTMRVHALCASSVHTQYGAVLLSTCRILGAMAATSSVW